MKQAPARARVRSVKIRLRNLVAGFALAVVALFVGVQGASAHVHSVTLTCKVLTVSLTKYQGHGNTIEIVEAGKTIVDTKFNSSYVSGFQVKQGETIKVVVHAKDDPNGAHGWSFTFNGKVPQCDCPPGQTTTITQTATQTVTAPPVTVTKTETSTVTETATSTVTQPGSTVTQPGKTTTKTVTVPGKNKTYYVTETKDSSGKVTASTKREAPSGPLAHTGYNPYPFAAVGLALILFGLAWHRYIRPRLARRH